VAALTRRAPDPAAAFAVVLGAALAVSAPAVALAPAVVVAARRSRLAALAVALVAAAAVPVAWRPFVAELGKGVAAAGRVGLAVDPPGALAAAWPHVWRWWLFALPLAPLYAAALHALRPRSVTDLEQRRERAERRRHARTARAASRAAARMSHREHAPRTGEALLPLGARISGDRFLREDRRRRVAMPLDWLHRHALVIGPSGSGKTETLLRLADGAARHGWAVHYIDAKGDRAGAARFAAAMAGAGRAATVFPDTALDGWRGDARAVYNRLIELVAYSTEGDGAYYRDVAKRVLWVACEGEPPRSSGELLERLDPVFLKRRDRGGGLDAAEPRAVAGVRLRYEAFFAALGERVDGDTSFEDADATYVLLDGLRLREEAQSLARMLVEDFADYATERKPRERPALLIVDEFSAIADAARVVELVERLRSFNVGVVLAPQVESGMGDEAAADRIVQNAETVFLHALRRPEGIASLAGTEQALESSYQQHRDRATGMGSTRTQHVFRVDPNEVRALRPGECFVIRAGRAAKVKIARVATTGAALAPPRPAPAPPAAPPARKAPELRL
jgi:hypothetical protein